MKKTVAKKRLFKSILVGIIVTGILMFFMLTAVSIMENRDYQRERIETMEKFLRFQTEAEITINESIALLQGYLSFIEINHDISEEESKAFLDNLLASKKTIIRNIGIMEDTTMKWNYPSVGNEEILGVDLQTIPEQKEDVLKVKNNGEEIFIGPIDLFQGGIGFIARLPIIRDQEYWGQISIVLDGLKYMQYIESVALNSELNIVVFNEDEYPTNPIYGDEKIVERDGLILDLEILNSKWVIATEPINGWNISNQYINILKCVSVLSSILIGFLIFAIIYSRSQLKYQAYFDQLTQLMNRHGLVRYIEKFENNDKIMVDKLYALMFDINYFKSINDLYGHDVGDEVLKEFSNRLNTIEIGKGKVFRLGGDEFLILSKDIDKIIESKNSSEYLKNKINFIYETENDSVKVQSSVGIAVYPKDGNTLEKLIAVADKRMYMDKDLMKKKQ